MKLRIALAGNPNSGKTTLFNALTGANQFVGNWPGVTVEKKEGKLRRHEGVTVTDLPGIYSLSPYSPEEVVARNYLTDDRPDVILNIVDGTNLERNLYLTTQLTELGIPVVVAVNMMDVVRKNGDRIDTKELAGRLGCRVVEISAMKGDGVEEAVQAVLRAAEEGSVPPTHRFSEEVEAALSRISERLPEQIPEAQRRWYAVKLFERDEKIVPRLALDAAAAGAIEQDIQAVEKRLDEDSVGVLTNERYNWISGIVRHCCRKKSAGRLSASDKIDRVVTNRWAGLPIFAAVMFLVYYISMVTVGTFATDWANDGLFGDGFHLLGIGSSAYTEAAERYGDSDAIIDAYLEAYGNEELAAALDSESEAFSADAATAALEELLRLVPADASVTYEVTDEETLAVTETPSGRADLEAAVAEYRDTGYKETVGAPATEDYGVWVPGIPVLLGNGLEAAGTPEWLNGLLLDGIVAGVGAVLGFVPQMLVLFLLLAVLEACGYLSRIAFVLDRIFRRFGLSGKSFIPMLVGSGCGVPGIMASRTIESERDRRMTIITTTFIPCGAKIPFISMIAGALFGNSPLVATSAYFIGLAAIIVSGIMLKKTRLFAGDPAPFVMELPAYRLPTVGNVLRSMWERGWSFIKKAGTVILLSTIVIWFTSYFGVVDGSFRMLSDEELEYSILAAIGSGIAWIFAPLGWGNWQAAVASVTGLVAKENIVGTMGILFGGSGNAYAGIAAAFTGVSGFSFLVFNLLCAPCFAAIGAIRREMNSAKWTWFAIGYQCGFAYAVALMVNQFGQLFAGKVQILGLIAALAVLAAMLWLLFRPAGRRVKKAVGTAA